MTFFEVAKQTTYKYDVVRTTPNPLMPSGWDMEEGVVPDYEIYIVELPGCWGETGVVVKERTKEAAIDAMKEFIREAQLALSRLRDLE